MVKLEDLTSSKAVLRAKLEDCKDVYRECSYELAFACLSPKELKPITRKHLISLAMNTSALVGACESKFALLGDGKKETASGNRKEEAESNEGLNIPSINISGEFEKAATGEGSLIKKEKENGKEKDKRKKEEILQGLKVQKEIEFGDEQLLRNLLGRVEAPLRKLQATVDRSVDIINTCIAYAYEVDCLPSPKQGSGPLRRAKGILLSELDIYVDWLSDAIEEFGKKSTEALEGSADMDSYYPSEVDIMPREEVFLISSFVMNLRQAACHTLDMLKHARYLVELRKERKGSKRLHLPEFRFKKWLSSGHEETEAFNLNSVVRQEDDDDDDDIDVDDDAEDSKKCHDASFKAAETREWSLSGPTPRDADTYHEGSKPPAWLLKFREGLADSLNWLYNSNSVLHSVKLTVGIMLLSFPAFILELTEWYHLARGVWVPFIFVLIFEDAIGSTIWIFFLRCVGTILGSAWGFAAYEARNGNEFVITVLLMLGIIPSFYVQLGTPYTKAGMVCTISMCVVAISTHLQTVPGTSFENFYKRTVAMVIGGTTAVLVQLILFPVKARVRLKESIIVAIAHIMDMESCVALGVDRENMHLLHSPKLLKRFTRVRKKAEAALGAAETYFKYYPQEPRLKGDFSRDAVVYQELLFVLRQIVDRMENLLQLRVAYGSAVLQEFNANVHSYRRNVAAAITLTLYTVSQGLALKLPLPQFLPSARLAQSRLVVRVRQLLQEATEEEEQQSQSQDSTSGEDGSPHSTISVIAKNYSLADAAHKARKRALRLKFLSWNASSAALEECVEYVEELVELTKLLVGVSEFNSGLLYTPTIQEYLDGIHINKRGINKEADIDTGERATADAASSFLPRLSSRLSRKFFPMASTRSTREDQDTEQPQAESSAGPGFREKHKRLQENRNAAVLPEAANEQAEEQINGEAAVTISPVARAATIPNALQRIQQRRTVERARRNSENFALKPKLE